MRVDQIITLVWVGNVALLGGTGWVGWKFWEQKKTGSRVPEVTWPEGREPVQQTRWPGPVTGFQHIWGTPFNGLVPPPPAPPETTKPKPVDPATAFRTRIQIVNAVAASSPWASMIMVRDSQGGGEKPLVCGQRIDDWKLVDVRVDLEKAECSAVFENPQYEKGRLTLTAKLKSIEPPKDPGPFRPSYGDAVQEGEAKRDGVDPQAYLDPDTGEWMVPTEEAAWWAAWGEAEIVQKTKFVERPQGVEVASMPPRAALDNTRGVTQGDIIVSINDTPVRTTAEILGYFRGAGRGLDRYVVVIERDGARRTQTYNVRRRASRPRE